MNNFLLTYKLILSESLNSAKQRFLNTNKVSQEIFNQCENIDPSKNKKYLEWMLKQIVNNKATISDIEKIIPIFDNGVNKNQIKNKDINAYKTLKDVNNIISSVPQTTKTQEKKELQNAGHDLNNVKIILDNDRFLIVMPLTQEASCHWGAGTEWCI